MDDEIDSRQAFYEGVEAEGRRRELDVHYRKTSRSTD
eukprot:COSAG02_NODE_1068_length_14812_cov_15.091342_8_plen_37_part_00